MQLARPHPLDFFNGYKELSQPLKALKWPGPAKHYLFTIIPYPVLNRINIFKNNIRHVFFFLLVTVDKEKTHFTLYLEQ